MTGAKILVVDDSIDMQKLICLYLRQDGYSFLQAGSGQEAIRVALDEMPDLILLDVMMPGMDGYETCRILKDNPKTADIPVLFLTAQSDTEHKIKGLDTGASDYIVKQADRGEILARIRNHLKIGQLTRQLIEKQRLIDEDMKAAAEIQQTLIPQKIPDICNIHVAWKFKPSQFVGGDIFNIIELDENNTAFYMIDVSGHGVPSAMITVSVSQMFMQNIDQLVKRKGSKNGLSEIVTPAEVLKKLDKHYPIERFGKYFSIVYIIVNTSRGYLHYSSAGHPQPVLITSEGEIKKLEKGGPLIGIGFPIDFEEEIVEFDTGCRLFLYTDGITECQNEKGEFFGTELLHSCFELFKNEAVEKAVENIFEKFLLFAGEVPFRDDISIIGVEHI